MSPEEPIEERPSARLKVDFVAAINAQDGEHVLPIDLIAAWPLIFHRSKEHSDDDTSSKLLEWMYPKVGASNGAIIAASAADRGTRRERIMDLKQAVADAGDVRSPDKGEQHEPKPGSAFPRLVDREQAARRDALLDKLQRKRDALKQKGA